jgi:hypothetical protein
MSTNAIKFRHRYIKRAARVLPAIQLGVPFTPEDIAKIVGGDYAAKFVFYLRHLGFEFSYQKDGRKVVGYTLIKEPDDVATIRGAAPSRGRGKNAAPKAPKVPKAPKAAPKRDKLVEAVKREGREYAKRKKTEAEALTKAVERWQDATNNKGTKAKVKAPKKIASTTKKSVADIKAKNLAKLKAVGERFAKANKPITDADILADAPKSTSFSIDDNWDSIDGLDLAKII